MMDPTILIVEDHDSVRKSILEWLSNIFPDYQFLEAKSGEEAVTQVLARPPDIVLMDIELPRMNGIDAVRIIKENAPKTQVVMLTIHEDNEYRTNAMAAGANAYVIKRKMYRELIHILMKLLSRVT